MKKICLFLMMAFTIISCGMSAEDWEKDYTGTWDLVGLAEMNWHSIENMRNYKLAETIDERISSDVEMTLVFKNGVMIFETEIESFTGTYTVDKDGAVFVDWEDGSTDTYWMYVQDDYLYMIEFGVDDFGELSGTQNAFKFRLVSK